MATIQLDVNRAIESDIKSIYNIANFLTLSIKLNRHNTNVNNVSNPTIQLLDKDESSQSDIQFTDGSVSITGTTATVDASTSSASSTPKIVKVSMSEGGETYVRTIPLSIASINEKSLTVQGNKVPSVYPELERKNGVADKSITFCSPLPIFLEIHSIPEIHNLAASRFFFARRHPINKSSNKFP